MRKYVLIYTVFLAVAAFSSCKENSSEEGGYYIETVTNDEFEHELPPIYYFSQTGKPKEGDIITLLNNETDHDGSEWMQIQTFPQMVEAGANGEYSFCSCTREIKSPGGRCEVRVVKVRKA